MVTFFTFDFLIIHTEDNRAVIQEAVEHIEKDLPELKGNLILYGQDNTDMGEEFVLNKIFETHFFVRKAHTIFVMWGNVIVKDFNIRKFLAFHLLRIQFPVLCAGLYSA